MEVLNAISTIGSSSIEFSQKPILHPVSLKLINHDVAIESNGVLIGDFQPKKWYFLAIDHEKPFMTRP